jgi:DNA-directed RNA polymerase subunit K/omega/cobalamin biosynthesis protein CobT
MSVSQNDSSLEEVSDADLSDKNPTNDEIILKSKSNDSDDDSDDSDESEEEKEEEEKEDSSESSDEDAVEEEKEEEEKEEEEKESDSESSDEDAVEEEKEEVIEDGSGSSDEDTVKEEEKEESDSESEYSDDDNFQKLENELDKKNLLLYHPELLHSSYKEIKALSRVVRDKNGIIIDPLHRTIPFLTKYERARILGIRAKQLNYDADPFVEVPTNMISGSLIALKELEEKKLPFIIRRPLPNGGNEFWKLSDLELINY